MITERAIKYRTELHANIEFLNHFTVADLLKVCREDGYPTAGNKSVLIVTIARKWADRDVPASVLLAQA